MNKVIELLGDKSCYYLDHTCKTIDKSLIHIPSPDTIDKIWLDSDRNHLYKLLTKVFLKPFSL